MILRMNEMKFFKTIAVLAALLLVCTIGFAQQQDMPKSIPLSNDDINIFIAKMSNLNPHIDENYFFDERVVRTFLNTHEGSNPWRTLSVRTFKVLTSKLPDFSKQLVPSNNGESYLDYHSPSEIIDFELKANYLQTNGSLFVLPKFVAKGNFELACKEYEQIFNIWKVSYPESYSAIKDQYKKLISEDFKKFCSILQHKGFIDEKMKNK